MKHTPGPWVVDHGCVDMEEQIEMLRVALGTTDDAWIAVGIEDEDGYSASVAYCHPANAPLIAAAPELLRACKVALKWFDTSHGNSKNHKVAQALRKALAAVKSEGGTVR